MALGILSLILAIVGSVTVVFGPLWLGFFIILAALLFVWAGAFRGVGRRDEP